MHSTTTIRPGSAIILTRVSHSSQEEEGYSLDSQAKLLASHADANSLPVMRVFRITETASKINQRKTFHAMLAFMEEQQVTHLIVEKVDRLTRNFRDAQAIEEWLERDERRHVIFVKNGLDLHKNAKSHETFMWSIFVAAAKQSVDNLREESMKGMLEKLAQGWYPSRPKIGYKNVRQDGKIIQVIDKRQAPLVVMLFTLMQTGNYSISRAWNEIVNLGLRTRTGRRPSRATIYKILTDPYYFGTVTWGGHKNPNGKHDPLISKELFDGVQEKLRRPETRAYRKFNLLFKGLLHCRRCGRSINWYSQKKYVYGECKNPECTTRGTSREDLLEARLLDAMSALKVPSEGIAIWVERELAAQYENDTRSYVASARALDKATARLTNRLETLYDDRLDGQITLQQYQTRRDAIDQELADLARKRAKISEIPPASRSPHVIFWRRSQTATARYKKLNDQDARRSIFREMFSAIELDGSEIIMNFRPEVQLLADTVREADRDPDRYEPPKTPSHKGTGSSFIKNRLLWLALVDRIRTIPPENLYIPPLEPDLTAPSGGPSSPEHSPDDLRLAA